jgi:hypothetical protein
MPIVLQPGTAVGGDLPYVLTRYRNFTNPFSGDLELEDHVTGKRVRIPAQMGEFDKKKMVPSSGDITMFKEPIGSQDTEPHPGDQGSPADDSELAGQAHVTAETSASAAETTETQTEHGVTGGSSEAIPPPSS